MKPLARVKISWSPNFSYAIGLLTTDGCLSGDGRHITFTSKDKEQIDNIQKCLGINLSVGKKNSGSQKLKKYYYVNIGDINFYRFLKDIGLMPNKSKIIKEVKIPNKYLPDFLRGHLDGDGTFYSYFDPRWKSSFMFYTTFLSASKNHINWLRKEINTFLDIRGHITSSKNSSVYQLKYAKKESLILLPKVYYNKRVTCLTRKQLKIRQVLGARVV